MDYVYVTYTRPAGQTYPSFGVLRTKNIDHNKFKPMNSHIHGVDVYFNEDE
jgi:hypothetical protein